MVGGETEANCYGADGPFSSFTKSEYLKKLYEDGPDEEDTAIAEAVRRMGGWRRICHSEERELGFLKREFQENYNQTTGGDYPAIVGSGDVRLIKAPATNNLLLN